MWSVRETDIVDPLLPECFWEVFLEGEDLVVCILGPQDVPGTRLGLSYEDARGLADKLNGMTDTAAYNAARTIN